MWTRLQVRFAGLGALALLIAAWVISAATPGGRGVAAAACSLTFETPKRLADAAVGIRYRETITASGASSERYFWQLTEGRLPPGLAITLGVGDGTTVVSGKPTTWGHYNFTIVLYDAPRNAPQTCPTPREFLIDIPAADVRVSQEGPKEPVKVGGRVVIDIRVSNDGPDATEKVSLTDVLPGGTKLQFGDVVEGAKGSCKVRPRGITLVCSLDRIRAGGGATIQLILKATDPGARENRVAVTGRTFDQFDGNNTSTLAFEIERPRADVSVTITGPAEFKAGETARYKAIVTNNGPGEALAGETWFPLSGGEVVELRMNGLKCTSDPVGGSPACDIGTLKAGASETVVVVITAKQAGSLVLNARARTGSDDPDPRNNRASLDVVAVK